MFALNTHVLPRSAGSWPGYVFTGEPLRLAATRFGLGHGSGAHAPDEYFVVESTNPKVQGMDGAVRLFDFPPLVTPDGAFFNNQVEPSPSAAPHAGIKRGCMIRT